MFVSVIPCDKFSLKELSRVTQLDFVLSLFVAMLKWKFFYA